MRTLIFGFLVISILKLTAQTGEQIQPKEVLPYVDVYATHKVLVDPDEIYLSITLSERIRGRDRTTVEEMEDSLKGVLQQINIPLDRLSIGSASAEYTKIILKPGELVTSKNYSLKLLNSEEVQKAFLAIDKIKPNVFYIQQVGYSKKDSITNIVLGEAMKKMKQKATVMVTSIDQQLGKLIFSNFNQSDLNNSKYTLFQSANIYGRGSLSDINVTYTKYEEPIIAIKKISIEVTVNGRFEVL